MSVVGDFAKRAVLRTLLYPHRLLPMAMRRHADRPAFADGVTFGSLLDRARRLAGHWAGLGLRPGDRLLVDLPNDAAFVEGRLAAILGGFAAVPIPPGTDEARAGWIGEFTGARAYLGTRPSAVPGVPGLLVDPQGGERGEYEAAVRRAVPLELTPPLGGDSPVTINFTSGTTGEPKGVTSTAAGWGWSLYHAMSENRVPIEPGEVFLHAVPLATAGSTLILPALLAGARSIFLPRWDAVSAADLVEKEGVTRIFLTPTMLAEFLDAVRAAGRRVSSLRAVIYGTEECPVARIRKAVGVLGPVLQQGYGMAEALPPVCLLHQDEHRRALRDGDDEVLGSAGRPTRAVDLGVFGDDDRPLPAGTPGSIRLKGRTVSPGYWRRPDLTEASRRGGRYVTGDVGFLDGRGYLHVLGREGRCPTEEDRRWVEWAESRSEVCAAWVEGTGGGRVLHLVPARGARVDEVGGEAVARGSEGVSAYAVHAQAPKTPSYKLAPAGGLR